MDVVYEDNHLIIVDKSSSEIVQGDKTGDKPLAEMVKEYIKQKYHKPGNVFLGVVHRLDRPVSGLVVFARTGKALARLNEMFRTKEVHKTYWAIVGNCPPAEEGELVHWLVRNEKQNKSYAYDKEKPGAKKDILDYKLIGTLFPFGNRPQNRPPPSNPLPVGQDGLPDQGRPEVRCAAQQPRREHLPACPPCAFRPPRIQARDRRGGTRA